MDHDKESIKKAMLKHEEIFRQQVHELHRLYGKQKLLMNNMKRGRSADLGIRREAIEESEIELTLGPSVYKTNRNGSSSGQSLCSSNSSGSSQARKGSTWEFSRSSSQNSMHPPWLFQALSLKLS